MKEHALPFEAVLIAMSKNKDGVKVTLVLHPQDDPASMADLFSHHIGSRYQVAMVLLGDDDQPVQRKKTAGDRAVADAGMLCAMPEFQQWLYDNGGCSTPSEDEAAKYLRIRCGVVSRSDLATNEAARRMFDKLRLQFSASRVG